METIVRFDGEQFRCRYFFDIDEQTEGIEVYYVPNDSCVGIIYDLCVPDEKDQEEVAEFEETVTNWLKLQDINYTMG
jgi:hypothetical protein